jgi:hypothetical protein
MRQVRNYLLVAAVLAALALPGMARAASTVGPYLPAEVACNSITNTISVKARIAAGDAYMNGQRVAYELQLYNASTGWRRLLINGQQWDVLYYSRWVWTQVVGGWGVNTWTKTDQVYAPTNWLEYPMGDGTYYLRVRYIWEWGGYGSGVWVDYNGYRYSDYSPWTMTTTYGNGYVAYGNLPSCQL